MLPSFEEYCFLIANLPNQFPSIRSSTLAVYTIGPSVAEVEGQLIFEESSYPHHRHVSPDIKHHRVPAPELSFTHPNLPFLIQEVEQQMRD